MTITEELLADLITLRSVNPAFLPSGHPDTGEQRVGEFLAAKAAKAGLGIEMREVFPGRSNLLARLEPSGKPHQRILLAPHLDTVNGSPDQFTPKRQGDRLYGRGACDTKGCVASMFLAVCELAQFSKRPQHTEIVFAGLVDEENAQAGSRALVKHNFKADLAIVGEATRLKVVTAHKGSLWLRLTTKGKSAHGSRPELGINAVHEMAKVVGLLETTYARSLKSRRHPVVGRATVSVGTICGGTQANIVPDACVITVDRRTIPGETPRKVCAEVGAMVRNAGLRASVEEIKLAPCLPMETDPTQPLVAQFMRSTGQTKALGVDYFCDAAVLAEGGIPSVVFGPGDIAQAHTADEWISMKSLNRCTDMLISFLKSLP